MHVISNFLRPTVNPVVLLVLVGQLLWGSVLIGGTLHGKVGFVGKGAKSASMKDAVVYFQSDRNPEVAPLEDVTLMSTKNKDFDPKIAVIPRGSRVRFPNADPILHNVFSVSGENRFDVGLYKKGPGEIVEFEHSGIVRVFCNVHRSMVAYVVVVETPYYAFPSSSGNFRWSGIPEGTQGTLHVWHPRARKMVKKVVTLPLVHPIDVTLEISKARIPKHKNKRGKSYSRRRYR